MLDLLFVYGTLHPDDAPPEIAHVARQLELLCKATIVARKVQFARYPAVILEKQSAAIVHGCLFRVDPALWPELDAYEQFDSRDPASSLFVRRRVMATRQDASTVEAWVYEYAQPLP